MHTEEITIRVGPQIAEAYRAASAEEKLKMEWLVSLQLQNFFSDGRSMIEVMDDIGRRAEERGLTPEILESILNEP